MVVLAPSWLRLMMWVSKRVEDQKAFCAMRTLILERGMLLTKSVCSRVAILHKASVPMERPSDIQGLIHIPFKTGWRQEAGRPIAKEMDAQGYNMNIKDLQAGYNAVICTVADTKEIRRQRHLFPVD